MKRGLLDALNRSERRSADPIDIAARELHQLCIATELIGGILFPAALIRLPRASRLEIPEFDRPGRREGT
jgi:hypothetical protein